MFWRLEMLQQRQGQVYSKTSLMWLKFRGLGDELGVWVQSFLNNGYIV